MSEYERSRTMTAPPETVFDRASDVDRLDSWLPVELHVRAEDPPAVTVHEDNTGKDERALFRAQPDQLRLEWGTRDDDRYSGWLQVAGISDQASEVTVHLSFFDEEEAPSGDEIDRALEKSLERLAEQVRV
ncbi:SRPBCC family protein [Planomonospora corallina]|uniref:SRPBCC family protein n=1 Tax=Planomonospora corallina TaxID=1806052 RepID=A0ABV8I907_9ACTN